MNPSQLLLTDLACVSVIGIIIGCALGFLLTVWNVSNFPIILTQFLAAVLRRKESIVFELRSRSQWTSWAEIHLPWRVAHFLNCPICQSPYLALLLTLCAAVLLPVGLAFASLPVTAIVGLLVVHSFGKVTQASRPAAARAQAIQNIGALAAPGDEFQEVTARPAATPPSRAVRPVTPQQQQLQQAAERFLEYQKRFGLKLEATVDGGVQTAPTSVTEKLKLFMPFFMEHHPCWFDGCAELRAQHAEVKASLAKDCATCEEGDVTRQFLIILDDMLEADGRTLKKRNGT